VAVASAGPYANLHLDPDKVIKVPHFMECEIQASVTLKFELGQYFTIFVQCTYLSSFIISCLIIQKLLC